MQSTESIALEKRSFNKNIVLPAAIILIGILANLNPQIIVLIMGAALVYYFWNHRENLVYALIIYTPLEELILKLLPDTFYAPVRYIWETILFSLFVLMFLENVILNKKWKNGIIDKAAIVFILGWLVSGFFNHISILTSLSSIKNFIRYFPLFYIIYNLGPDEKFLRKIIYAFVGIAVIESLICFGQALGITSLTDIFRPKDVIVGGNLIRGEDIQTGSYYTRFTGTFARSNDLGNYLSFGLCFLAALYFKSGRKRLYLIMASALSIALIISSSRISLISAFVALGVILFKIGHRFRYRYFLVPVVLVIIILFSSVAIDMSNLTSDFNILGRFYYLFTPDYIDNISNFGRLYAILSAAPAVFMNSPLLGIGPGSFMRLSAEVPVEEVFAGSGDLGLETAPLNYVQDVGYAAVFIQVGLIGLIALIWIFVKLYGSASKSLNQIKSHIVQVLMLSGMGIIISMAIQNLASTNLMYRNQSVVIWTICGLIALFSRNSTKSSRKNFNNILPDYNSNQFKG